MLNRLASIGAWIARPLRQTVLTLSTCVALVSAYAADSLIQFRSDLWDSLGIETIKPGAVEPYVFAFKAEEKHNGRKALAPSTMRSIGGIIFFESASPEKDTAACPTLSYDLSRANGQRFVAAFGKDLAIGDIYDWEVIPTVSFASSGDHGLFTYMGYHAQYHKAFADNLAGVNLFFVDNMRNIQQFSDIHRTLGKSLPGYPQTNSTSSSRLKSDVIRTKLRWSQLMFTDEGVRYSFRNQNGTLNISGAPYWIGVQQVESGAGREILRIDNTNDILETNPVVYGSVIRIAKFTALFRHFIKNCPNEWSAFTADLGAKRGSIDLVKVAQMPYKL